MKIVALIVRRELNAFVLSPLGYCMIAGVLFLHGLLFNVAWMRGEHLSFDVLQGFFYQSSGFVAVAALLLSMRLFAEERQTGTMVLLLKAPAREWQIVLGKFIGAYLMLCVYLVLTSYMPLLIVVNGKVTLGHVFAGYFGLLLLGAAVLAVGTLASSLASTQLLAAVLGSIFIALLFSCWMIAGKIPGPLGDLIAYLDLMDAHYRSFAAGIVKSTSIVYFASLTYLALLAATTVLASRRWRG